MTAGAPVLTGVMRQVRAQLEGRAGLGSASRGGTCASCCARRRSPPTGPANCSASLRSSCSPPRVAAAVAVPFVTTASAVGPVADLFAVVALLALGTATLALAALDTGTAFGGMGASREMTILALVEPTLLVSVFALSVRAGSTNLAAIVTATLHDPGRVISPASLLAAVALGVVTIAETGRMPVDNPATHLELTMVHEAMILEYAGPDLALIELGVRDAARGVPRPAVVVVPPLGHRHRAGTARLSPAASPRSPSRSRCSARHSRRARCSWRRSACSASLSCSPGRSCSPSSPSRRPISSPDRRNPLNR